MILSKCTSDTLLKYVEMKLLILKAWKHFYFIFEKLTLILKEFCILLGIGAFFEIIRIKEHISCSSIALLKSRNVERCNYRHNDLHSNTLSSEEYLRCTVSKLFPS